MNVKITVKIIKFDHVQQSIQKTKNTKLNVITQWCRYLVLKDMFYLFIFLD